MTDRISEHRRSYNMRQIRSKDTGPEMAVRRSVHNAGYRYRLHSSDLPGKPDLVFRSRRKAVFVHGCFWHQHPSDQCGDSREPKSRQDYWGPKLARNVVRDTEHLDALTGAGWSVLVIWECEVENRSGWVSERLLNFLAA